jgi:hypothetical protein
LGHNWFQRLKRRRECLHEVWTKKIEKARKRATLDEKLDTWFNELEQVRRVFPPRWRVIPLCAPPPRGEEGGLGETSGSSK